MYTRLATALLAVGLAIAVFLGSSTFAFLSDLGASNDNQFNSSQLDLRINDEQSLSGFFGTIDWFPGDVHGPVTINLTNEGSLTTGLALDYRFEATQGDVDLAAVICMLQQTYDGSDIVEPANGTGPGGCVSLRDLVDHGVETHEPEILADLVLEFEFHPSAGLEYEGETTDITITFFLRQKEGAPLA